MAAMFCENCGNLLEVTARFCEHCGQIKRIIAKTISNNSAEEELIKQYFKRGYSNQSILKFLWNFHSICYSQRTLKRRLKRYGLNRSQNISTSALRVVMTRLTNGPSTVVGYRSMWYDLTCNYGIRASRDKVMRLLREIDPTASEQRKSRQLRRRTYSSKGSNDTWHVDGYDKLKPFGLPIHGAVDGFSRKILWLKLCRTNNNPQVAAYFFVETLKEIGSCPRLLRTDAGTENGIMASIQCLMRGTLDAHRYGNLRRINGLKIGGLPYAKHTQDGLLTFLRPK